MYDQALNNFTSHGIEVESTGFPYTYFDRYIYTCNPSLTRSQLLDRLQRVKSRISAEYYDKILLFGATINLMKEYHYDFLVAMIHDKEFCNWITSLYAWFEPLKNEIEDLTSCIFK
jgi:hypothetical protein